MYFVQWENLFFITQTFKKKLLYSSNHNTVKHDIFIQG